MTSPVSDSLAGLTAQARSAAKASAFAARPAPDPSLMAGTRMVSVSDVQMVDIPVERDGVPGIATVLQFRIDLWMDGGSGMTWFDLDAPAATSPLWKGNPLRVANPPVLVPDPAGDIVRTSTDPRTAVVTETRWREDLDQALMQMAFDATAHFTAPSNEF
jgi:hypothetical protein